MNALVLKDGFGLENLQYAERPDPEPGPGQVLLRMKAASLNSRDLLRVLINITSPSETRSIPAGIVARRLNTPDMRPSGALPAGRLGPQLDEFILTRALKAIFRQSTWSNPARNRRRGGVI